MRDFINGIKLVLLSMNTLLSAHLFDLYNFWLSLSLESKIQIFSEAILTDFDDFTSGKRS